MLSGTAGPSPVPARDATPWGLTTAGLRPLLRTGLRTMVFGSLGNGHKLEIRGDERTHLGFAQCDDVLWRKRSICRFADVRTTLREG